MLYFMSTDKLINKIGYLENNAKVYKGESEATEGLWGSQILQRVYTVCALFNHTRCRPILAL